MLAGLKTRGVQDQRSTVRLSDKAEIDCILIYYLLTAQFAGKAKSKQAMPVSAHPQWQQIPVHPGGIPPAKNWDSWLQIKLFGAGFAMGGVVGVP